MALTERGLYADTYLDEKGDRVIDTLLSTGLYVFTGGSTPPPTFNAAWAWRKIYTIGGGTSVSS